ncbi:MAG: ABC transporter ATP-binding protein [Acidimicrobiales bacterium]
MSAIEVADLHLRFGATRAVDGLSFEAEEGEVVALLGANGAGKTSTVETLEGYRTPTAGQVRVLGLDPVADHARLTHQIGVMLQSGGIYPGIRPIEAVRLFAALHGVRDRRRPEDLLARVGLSERARLTWRRLSGGEQQRLSLALALVGRPRVAFLDEPTAGVDVGGRQVIRRVVSELRDEGTCVLLTTHELEEAERLADRVLIIDRGRLVASGTPQELRAGGAEEIRFGAPRGLDVVGLGEHLGAPVSEESPGEYRVQAPPSPAMVAALTEWLARSDLALADLRAGRHTLEDVFLRLTGSGDPVQGEAR